MKNPWRKANSPPPVSQIIYESIVRAFECDDVMTGFDGELAVSCGYCNAVVYYDEPGDRPRYCPDCGRKV
jgi:hypothetical protein